MFVSTIPLGRLSEASDIGDAVAFLASQSFLTVRHLRVLDLKLAGRRAACGRRTMCLRCWGEKGVSQCDGRPVTVARPVCVSTSL